jgi:hypothetical protein
MAAKRRLSATVDADLVQAGQEAVSSGEAESISAWVNDALRLKADRDRRQHAFDDFITAYEAEHGVITEEEMEAAARSVRRRAIVIRGDMASGPEAV